MWVEIDVCNPEAGEGCVVSSGGCDTLEPVGGIEPRGKYLQYAFFDVDSGVPGGYDIDSFGDLLYMSIADEEGTRVEVYRVSIEDSDADGEIEPIRHDERLHGSIAIRSR